jgi:hypothetical protein
MSRHFLVFCLLLVIASCVDGRSPLALCERLRPDVRGAGRWAGQEGALAGIRRDERRPQASAQAA